jgi:hypothetical protein
MNILKLSWLWRAISQNRYDGKWMGYGEKDKRRTGYADPGDRWRRESEAKLLANGWFFK